ncbi:MAG: hypothetical protein LBD67_05610 [Candidatus Accumulibacter sp.]|jgi:hypothetical protein|nr:hypothetical protein [Accumulibacter sp.]
MKWRCFLSPPFVVILPGYIDDTLFPFVLSLSKQERTLRGLPNASLIRIVQGKGIPGLSNPCPSTGSGQAG